MLQHQQQREQKQREHQQQQAATYSQVHSQATSGGGGMGMGVSQQQSYHSPNLAGRSKNSPMSHPLSPYARMGVPPPMSPSPMIDPMDDGDEEDDLLSPEEEMLVAPREFGRIDRLNKEAKRERLKELNSPFPTRKEMQAALDGLQSAGGKGLLEMATFLHYQLEELVAVEQKEKVTKLRFRLDDDADDADDDGEDKLHIAESKENEALVRQGPRSTIGVLLADRPEALGMPGRCVVHGSVPGSPAYFSGKIKQGDVILQVDEQNVSPDNVVTMMCGNDVPGTRIKLMVDRAKRKRPFAVHLIRAEVDTVAQRRGVFEMLATLAEAAGTGPLEQDPNLDDRMTTLYRELIEKMKLMQREKTEDDLILLETLDRKDRALVKAQLLIREFVMKSQKLLSSLEPSTNESSPTTNKAAPTGYLGSILSLVRGSEDDAGTVEKGQTSVDVPQDRVVVSPETSDDCTTVAKGKDDKLEAEVSELQMQLQAAHDHATLLNLELETLKQRLEVAREEQQEHERLSEQLKAEHVKADEELQDQQQLLLQLKEANDKCSELSKANDVLTGSLDEAESVLQELRSDLNEKSDVIKSLHECRTFQDEVSSPPLLRQ